MITHQILFVCTYRRLEQHGWDLQEALKEGALEDTACGGQEVEGIEKSPLLLSAPPPADHKSAEFAPDKSVSFGEGMSEERQSEMVYTYTYTYAYTYR